MPTETEKNTCPMAFSAVAAVIFEKSGVKKNLTPCHALSSVNTRIINTNNRTNSPGIMILQYFSMPFSMPMYTMPAVISR